MLDRYINLMVQVEYVIGVQMELNNVMLANMNTIELVKPRPQSQW